MIRQAEYVVTRHNYIAVDYRHSKAISRLPGPAVARRYDQYAREVLLHDCNGRPVVVYDATPLQLRPRFS